MNAVARAEAWLSAPTNQDEAADIIMELLGLLESAAPEPVLHPILGCEMILRALQSRESASVLELKDLTGFSVFIVRRHLQRLCYEGRVVCVQRYRPAGRPRSGCQQPPGEPPRYGLAPVRGEP